MGDKGWPKIELTFDSVEYEQRGNRQVCPFAEGKRSCFLQARDVHAMLSPNDKRKLVEFSGDSLSPSSMLPVSYLLQNYAWNEFDGGRMRPLSRPRRIWPIRNVLDPTFPQRNEENKIVLSAQSVLINPRVVTKFDGKFATLWLCMLPGMVLRRRVSGAALVRDLVVHADRYLLSCTNVNTSMFDRVAITNVHEFNFLFIGEK